MTTDKRNSIIAIDNHIPSCKSFVKNCHCHYLLNK